MHALNQTCRYLPYRHTHKAAHTREIGFLNLTIKIWPSIQLTINTLSLCAVHCAITSLDHTLFRVRSDRQTPSSTSKSTNELWCRVHFAELACVNTTNRPKLRNELSELVRRLSRQQRTAALPQQQPNTGHLRRCAEHSDLHLLYNALRRLPRHLAGHS